MSSVTQLIKQPVFIVLSGLAVVALMVILFSTLARAQEKEPDPPLVHMQSIGRSMTNSGVTVHLHEIVHSPDRLSAKFSYQTESADMPVDHLLKGFDLIRSEAEPKWGSLSDANGLTELSVTGHDIEYRLDGADNIHARFPLDGEVQDGAENMSISLGTYMIPLLNLSGSVKIELGNEYGSARMNRIPSTHSPIKVPLEAEFIIGRGTYSITELTIFPQAFEIVIQPVNEDARRRPFGIMSPSKMPTVTYEDGTSIKGSSGLIQYDEQNPRGFTFQRVVFHGSPPNIDAHRMTLTVRGGVEIVGPFIFEDVPVIVDEIHQIEYTPPSLQGPPTPTPIPTQVPTTVPEPSPEPTSVPSLAVRNLIAEAASGTITLTWDAPASSDVQGYEILRQILGTSDAQSVANLDAHVTSYVDSAGLQSSTGYAYTIRTISTGVMGETKAYIKVQLP